MRRTCSLFSFLYHLLLLVLLFLSYPILTMSSTALRRTYLITGTSRGIGLGLVSHLLREHPQDRVIATCRDPSASAELNELTGKYSKEQLLVLSLDVTSWASHQEAKEVLALEGIDKIDVLIANAGVASPSDETDFFSCSAEDLEFVWRTNVLGSMLTMQAYADEVLKSSSKLCVVVSSQLGSIERAMNSGGVPAYRSSKAGLNMLAVTYGEDPKVRQAGGKILCLHPGWVQTDMGGSGGRQAPLTVSQSVTGIVDVLNRACQVQAHAEISKHLIEREHDAFKRKLMTDHCVFVGYNGELLPW